jgi:hypothetical protein
MLSSREERIRYNETKLKVKWRNKSSRKGSLLSVPPPADQPSSVHDTSPKPMPASGSADRVGHWFVIFLHDDFIRERAAFGTVVDWSQSVSGRSLAR